MRIVGAELRPYALALQTPWQSARSHLGVRRGWHVVLSTSDGRAGWGECAPLSAAGTEEAATAEAWLQGRLPGLVGLAPAAAAAALEATAPPAARFALETALLDLEAQARGVPLWRLLTNAPAPGSVACNAASGPLDAGLERRLAAAAADGFRVAKVKVGLGPVDEEARQLRALGPRLPTGMVLRLDANAAWSEAGALAFIEGLDGLAVEMLEEPLARPEPAALARLQAAAPWPLALDENLLRVGIAAVAAQRPVTRAVLKAAVCGGLRRAAAIARQLQSQGIGCVVTTTLEGPVGTWAALHLAIAAGSPGLAHGLATGGWFEPREEAFPPLDRGSVRRPEQPGLGSGAPTR